MEQHVLSLKPAFHVPDAFLLAQANDMANSATTCPAKRRLNTHERYINQMG
jgi:hypothetical protein